MGVKHVKILWTFFSGNDPSRSKNMREIRIWHFEAKNTPLIQERCIVYGSEKSQKFDFYLKTTPFGVKICGKSVVFRPKYVIFSNFCVDIQLFLFNGLYKLIRQTKRLVIEQKKYWRQKLEIARQKRHHVEHILSPVRHL
jgi:hypothetical protein